MNDDKPILRGSGLVKIFGTGHTAVRAVDGVDIAVGRGEIVLIMGPSGSGKTTLLSMLGGLLRPTEGKVELGGQEITALDERELPAVRARSIGFIFQAFHLLAALGSEDNVLLPARLASTTVGDARARARALLGRLGLSDRLDAKPAALSGGEKQRVAIARALINQPHVILADEPTGNLDSSRGQEVMMILHDIARDEGRAVVIVTHDPRVEDIADRILWLEDGLIRDRKAERHEWVRDPVCGMRVDRWTATQTAQHEGTEYAFCMARCRERFVATPEAYADSVAAAVSERAEPQ